MTLELAIQILRGLGIVATEVRALRNERRVAQGQEPLPDWPRTPDGHVDFDAALRIQSEMDRA